MGSCQRCRSQPAAVPGARLCPVWLPRVVGSCTLSPLQNSSCRWRSGGRPRAHWCALREAVYSRCSWACYLKEACRSCRLYGPIVWMHPSRALLHCSRLTVDLVFSVLSPDLSPSLSPALSPCRSPNLLIVGHLLCCIAVCSFLKERQGRTRMRVELHSRPRAQQALAAQCWVWKGGRAFAFCHGAGG